MANLWGWLVLSMLAISVWSMNISWPNAAAATENADITPGSSTKTTDVSNATVNADITPGSSTKTTDAYSPNPIEISLGDTVIWTNKDSIPHTVTSGNGPDGPTGAFGGDEENIVLITPGQKFEHTFSTAGEFEYYCMLHPTMIGQVVVAGSSSVDVRLQLAPDPPIPELSSTIKIAFLQPGTTIIQQHIDYDVKISDSDGFTIFSAAAQAGQPMLHTADGTVDIPYTFTEAGDYNIKVTVFGILFNPVTPKTTSFDVTSESVIIIDLPPELTLPGNIARETTDESGLRIDYEATAEDSEDGNIPVSCSPSSGSIFPIGTTIVECTATDSADHAISDTFAVSLALNPGPVTFSDPPEPVSPNLALLIPVIIIAIIVPIALRRRKKRDGEKSYHVSNGGSPDDAAPHIPVVETKPTWEEIPIPDPMPAGREESQPEPASRQMNAGPPIIAPVDNVDVPETRQPDSVTPMPHNHLSFPSSDILKDDLVQQLMPKNYRAIKAIGKGGYSTVYLCENTNNNNIVAMKIPKIDGLETIGRKFADDFIREAEVWRKLKGPSVVHVYEYGTSPLPWIAVEYMEGGNLRGKLKQGQLPVTSALDIAGKILDGLIDAHAKGIIHLDIKPENILFTKEGEPKVADWGLAKVLFEVGTTTSGTFKGTVTYATPEQFAPKQFGDPDHRTDIYQAAAVLYEMLTGKPPFEGKDMFETMANIQSGQFVPPSSIRTDVPEALDSALLKALSK